MSKIELKDAQTYAAAVLQDVENRYGDKNLCDVVLIAGMDRRRFVCHRLVLACYSEFFRVMFTSPMRESQQSEIVLNEVSGEQLKPLLAFIYTGAMELHEDEDDIVDNTAVKKLLYTASLLQVDAALVVCVDYLKKRLTTANSLGIYEMAKQYSLDKLQHEAEKYVFANFTKVCRHEEFLQMPFELLEPLISSDQLNVRSEEMVFNNVMNWVHHDTLNRQQHLPDLLKQIRMPLLSVQFLNSKVRDICMDHDCAELFSNVMSWKNAPSAPTELSLQQTKPRYGSETAQLLAVLFRDEDEQKKIIIEIYNHIGDEWSRCGEMERRIFYAVIVFDKSLIFAGGWNKINLPTNTVVSFDLKTKTSKQLCPMLSTRYFFRLALLEDMIYAVGGRNDISSRSVERYNPVTNTWTNVESMTYARSFHELAVLNGLLYAVGGSEGRSYLNSTECYDPRTDRWTCRANLTYRRHNHSVVVAHGYLYAIAGEYSENALKTVERYDPQRNEWTLLCSLENLEGKLRCALVGERLLASSRTGTVEEYNFKKDTWSYRAFWDKIWFEFVSVPELSNLKLEELIY